MFHVKQPFPPISHKPDSIVLLFLLLRIQTSFRGLRGGVDSHIQAGHNVELSTLVSVLGHYPTWTYLKWFPVDLIPQYSMKRTKTSLPIADVKAKVSEYNSRWQFSIWRFNSSNKYCLHSCAWKKVHGKAWSHALVSVMGIWESSSQSPPKFSPGKKMASLIHNKKAESSL